MTRIIVTLAVIALFALAANEVGRQASACAKAGGVLVEGFDGRALTGLVCVKGAKQ